MTKVAGTPQPTIFTSFGFLPRQPHHALSVMILAQRIWLQPPQPMPTCPENTRKQTNQCQQLNNLDRKAGGLRLLESTNAMHQLQKRQLATQRTKLRPGPNQHCAKVTWQGSAIVVLSACTLATTETVATFSPANVSRLPTSEACNKMHINTSMQIRSDRLNSFFAEPARDID